MEGGGDICFGPPGVGLSRVICLGSLVQGQLSWVTRLAQSVLDHSSRSLVSGRFSRDTCPGSPVLGRPFWAACPDSNVLSHLSWTPVLHHLPWVICPGPPVPNHLRGRKSKVGQRGEHDKGRHFGNFDGAGVYLGRGGNTIDGNTLLTSMAQEQTWADGGAR